MWSTSDPVSFHPNGSPRQGYAGLPGFAVHPIVYDPEIHRRWRVGRTRDDMNAIRTGVQVHAVPENERAYDSSGRRLPWGYTYADSERRYPEEKGPFGKSTSLRSISRSRTYTPARKEDQAKLDQIRAEDEVVKKWKASVRDKNKTAEDLRDNALAAIDPNMAPNAQATAVAKEPTEVILYGFGAEQQWAAIAFYERASQGIVYEDYDRMGPTGRFDHTFANSASRAASLSRLSQAALRKKNTYVGGEHWIKVTFDSPESADNACRTSPHKVCGYMVYAERFRGVGPDQDVSIFATPNGEVMGTQSPPNSQSTHTMSGGLPDSPESSATASSATATAAGSSASAPPPAPAGGAEQVTYPNLRRTTSGRRRHPLMQTQNASEDPEAPEQRPTRPRLDTYHIYPEGTPSARNMPPHTRINPPYRAPDSSTPSPSPSRELDPSALAPDSGLTDTGPASDSTAVSPTAPTSAPPATPLPHQPQAQSPTAAPRLRIRNARTVTLAPATSAVLPTQPGWRLFLVALPFVGVLFAILLGVPSDAVESGGAGGGGASGHGTSGRRWEVIGSQVPRREDGGFDWEGAGVWWRVCWWLDGWLGTDLCGMRGDD
ncbi:hypothetical protein EV356DRAFT_564399 [Viridothelium virens]|uniref:Uncharacterized protein n=1 Tax=Viridothelium virens TaxID=1048519 RepID=A0A6A6HJY8_VIRVR|nr:hypothetical protein EV356DRAFT_564399 [Viridothelium virens]